MSAMVVVAVKINKNTEKGDKVTNQIIDLHKIR
jgi:hypothetical protein